MKPQSQIRKLANDRRSERRIRIAKTWQKKAVDEAVRSLWFLILAPGGSGKSLAQCMAGAIDFEQSGNKQLVLVPQNHIHCGFYDPNGIQFRLSPQGKVYHWHVAANFCSPGKNAKKSDALRRFLLTDASELKRQGKSAAIATHMLMVRVWELLTPDEKAQAIQNITFRIDEAHHISGVFECTELDEGEQQATIETATKLGAMCRYLLDANSKTTKLHLSTATFFRGDRNMIVSEEAQKRFNTYQLSWDEYYQGLGLESFHFDFQQYETDPIDLVIESIRQERRHRHLVILPALTRRFRKDTTLNDLLQRLAKLFPPDKILDLVTEATQERNKGLLLAQPGDFRVVVACRLFDEGTDWVICDRMHNTDAGEKSLTLAVQRFYRPFRHHSKKKTVKIINYVRSFPKDIDEEQGRKLLTDRLNTVLASIVTCGEFAPILVPVNRRNHADIHSEPLPLQELYGHSEYVDLLDGLLRGYEGIKDKTDSANIAELVESLIDEHGVPENVDREDLLNALLSLVIRVANPKARNASEIAGLGVDVRAIACNGFDKVWKKQGCFTSSLCFGTENITAGDFRELLRVIERPLTLENIHSGIKKHYEITNKRLTYKTGWIEALGTTSMAVEKLLRRCNGSTLATEVDRVLGNSNDNLLNRTKELIRTYSQRGIRLTRKFGDIPELGVTGRALDARLAYHYDTTLGAEVEKIMGPFAAEIDLDEVRQIIEDYSSRGITLGRKYGHIPELGVTSYALHDRLSRNHKLSLTELVNDTLGISREITLSQVRYLISRYLENGLSLNRNMGVIPELGITVNALNLRLKKHGTTLANEIRALRQSHEP